MPSVKNLSVWTLHHKVKQIYVEVDQSVSSSVSHMREPDVGRMEQYLAEFAGYVAHVKAMDPVDWPHWHAHELPFEHLPELAVKENAAVNELLLFLKIMSIELVESQSKDLPAGLVVYDMQRLEKNIAYAHSLLDYVKSSTPTDRPEAAQIEANSTKK